MATQKRNALGRGLDALLSMDDVKTEGSSSINEIELAKITVNPNQPRREFAQTMNIRSSQENAVTVLHKKRD